MFETSILKDVTGPGVDKAQEEAARAKDYLHQVLHSEVHSKTIRDMLWAAIVGYAEARVEIVEAKVGKDTATANQISLNHDMEMITLLAASDSPQAEAIRAKNRAEMAEVFGALEK